MATSPSPVATASVTASVIPQTSVVLLSSTVTVNFVYHVSACSQLAFSESVAITAIAPPSHPTLLLTLSPLHRVRDARVLLTSFNKLATHDITASGVKDCGVWHQLDLNRAMRRTARQRVARDSQVMTYSTLISANVCGEKELERQESGCDSTDIVETVVAKQDEQVSTRENEDVLELVLESSDDETKASPRETAANASDSCDYGDDVGIQFILDLLQTATPVDDIPYDHNNLPVVLSCCINVVSTPPLHWMNLSYPSITVSSFYNSSPPPDLMKNDGRVIDEEGYIILAGQRLYDFFICPRVAYATAPGILTTFGYVDVSVTAVELQQEHLNNGWSVVLLSPLPVLAEDFVCAFVLSCEPRLEAVSLETHENIPWSVRHHAVYTSMTAIGEKLPDNGIASTLYFFHSDHTFCTHLLAHMQLAHSACKSCLAGTVKVAVDRCMPDCHSNVWVVTEGSSVLLGLRRGFLCTRGVALISNSILRAAAAACDQTPPTLPVAGYAESLRGKVSLLSAALELVLQSTPGGGSSAPEFTLGASDSVGSAIARAWSLCLLSHEHGWSELLRQERQILSHGLFSNFWRANNWCLQRRYLEEVYATLVFLSSAFVVASLRHSCCDPWALVQCSDDPLPQLSTAGEEVVSLSGGMHLTLVRYLVSSLWRRSSPRVYGFLVPPINFVAAVSYVAKLDQRTLDYNVSLYLEPDADALSQCPRDLKAGCTQKKAVWEIDIPFTLLHFSVRGHRHSGKHSVTKAEDTAPYTCCVDNSLQFYWRVSGYDWMRGISQQASFTMMMGSEGCSSSNMCPPSADRSSSTEGTGGVDRMGSDAHCVQLVLLVLNNKIAPASLSMKIEHARFWSGLSDPTETLAYQAILGCVIMEAVLEGTSNKSEADCVFTSLLNQLLEDLINRRSNDSVEDPAVSLVLGALEAQNVDVRSLHSRLHSDISARLSYFVYRARGISPNNYERKRQREVSHVELCDSVSSRRLTERMIVHLRTMEAYQASATHALCKQQGTRRLMLNLRRTSHVDPVAVETPKQVMPTLREPSDVATSIARTMYASLNSNEPGAIAARRSALFLLLPLCLLLSSNRRVSEAQECSSATKVQAMRDVYQSLTHGTAEASYFINDTFILHAFYSILQEGDGASS
ncbi:hypothetical protein TRVL_00217 [Trypanosoma vivax]|nr:hypothetical protein TRVL_00217 [Trypanosoma vivax]